MHALHSGLLRVRPHCFTGRSLPYLFIARHFCTFLCAEANSVQIAAARHEFGGAHGKMGRAHAEAAALGGELLEAAAAAAAAGSAVRHMAAQPYAA
jgi:hypothetical protein